jgi:hypothetical protein
LCGVALGKGEDSFEAIPEIFADSTTGYQAWDAEVPQVPQATCLMEVLEECGRSVAGEEIHQVARDGGHSVKDASAWGRSCRGGCSGRCLRSVSLWGGKSGGRRGGCSSIGYHRAMGAGSVGRRGGDRGGRLVKALLKVPHILQQCTQIDHRVSVVFLDDGERLTFGGAKGVRRRRSGHQP